jgi:formamidopyrimidine-DNA glycosylase
VPELLEIEQYRQAMLPAIGHRIASLDAPDPLFLKGGLDEATLRGVVVGRTLVAARRRGKLLLLDLDDGGVLGVRFGMTGRLVVDGAAVVDKLESGRPEVVPAWERFRLVLDEGVVLAVDDPRRLGGVVVDPDEEALGPDASTLTRDALRAALAGSRAPLKARLMDQARVAGLGNLLTDEALWRAGLDPAREAGSLDGRALGRLHRAIADTLDQLGRRGGSHTGDLMPARTPGGSCPRDGTPLVRSTVGGRTTYTCPGHQR